MPDTIGNITVPAPSTSAAVFPVVSDFGHGRRIEPQVAIHRFLSGNSKIEQRFLLGTKARRWRVTCARLRESDLTALKNFWEARKGPYTSFTYNAPSDSGTSTSAITVNFQNEPLTWERLVGAVSTVGVVLVEAPAAAPTYSLSATVTRFPSGALETALAGQVQELIPLIKIIPKEVGYPAIYLSDRRVTVGAQLYLPRLLTWDGISQSLDGGSDTATFSFGNADKVMRDLAADTDLFRASLEFSLFHVGTLTKIDLWKGDVVDYKSNSFSPEFTMSVRDGLYALTLRYPPDKITRTCYKPFDGPGCPYSTQGSGGNPAFCDKGYATTDGCKSHGMDRHFPGVIADPQGIRIRDNGQDGRPTITATSLISDSAFGLALPEIYTDIPMTVPGIIVSGRDESDFYAALIVAGAGPLSLFGGISLGDTHKLDGQTNHLYPPDRGREILGSDPAGVSDYFSIDDPGVGLRNYSAGVAFVVVRRADEKGIQLTRLDQHSAELRVLGGLSGRVWTAPGSQTSQVLTSPIWVAAHVFLRGIGRRLATTGEAEAVIDIVSAIASAGICSTSVSKLVGAGTETQFKFIGSIREPKPLRDWLQEIFNTALAYGVFDFGKLRMGMRSNATATQSFTAGNIILGSLNLRPLKPAFNRLTVNYASADYGFTILPATVQSDAHIAYLGQTLDSEMNLVGVATPSQAGRIASIRLREELGGAVYSEWKKAREGSLLTTVLALSSKLGECVSVTDGEVPGGTGKFRQTAWKLNPDYSIEIGVRTVTDSMYDLLTAGPKIADVPVNPIPPEFFPVPLKPAWHPNEETPLSGDPLYATDHNSFALGQEYTPLGDGSQQAVLMVRGKLPVNDFIPDAQPPMVASFSQAATGGSLPGDINVSLAICARDADGKFTPPSNITRVALSSGAATKKITLTDITWPSGTYDGYVLFAAEEEQAMCAQVEFSGALPSSVVLSALKRSTYNMPTPVYRNVRAKAKRLVHGGTIGIAISGVATGKITVAGLAGLGDDWSDRILSIIADASDGSAPLWNFHCSTYNDATGEFTVTPDPLAAGVEADDVLLIRLKPTTYTGLTIGDAKIENGIYPTGAVVDAEIGLVIRGVTPGKRHQLRRVVSNTSTVYTVDREFDFQPTYFIVETADWPYVAESTPVKTITADLKVEIRVVSDNLRDQPVIVGVFLVDRNMGECPEELAPVRELYQFGMLADFSDQVDLTVDPQRP